MIVNCDQKHYAYCYVLDEKFNLLINLDLTIVRPRGPMQKNKCQDCQVSNGACLLSSSAITLFFVFEKEKTKKFY